MEGVVATIETDVLLTAGDRRQLKYNRFNLMISGSGESIVKPEPLP